MYGKALKSFILYYIIFHCGVVSSHPKFALNPHMLASIDVVVQLELTEPMKWDLIVIYEFANSWDM